MRKPRGPNHPFPGAGGTAHERNSGAQPFVRLATLAPRDRSLARASSYEERTGALIRRAAVPDGVNPRRLDRVWERLEHRQPARAPIIGAFPLRWAVVAAVLLSAGAVAAGTGAWTWPHAMVRRLMGEPAQTSVRVGPTTGATARPPRREWKQAGIPSVDPAPVDPPPADASAPPVGEASARPALMHQGPLRASLAHRAPGEPHAAPSQAPAIPHDAQLADESESLSHALVQLRQARNPVGALVELDRYAARWPSGILQREALVARVDALLMAGRSSEAREILSRLTLGSEGRDRELRLIRAELTAGSACAVALPDYEAAWAAHPGGSDGERALWGKAACHVRLGDESRARVELTRYLAQFPDGPHAADARARLQN